MNQKNFNLVTTAVFLIIALLHLLRLTYNWEANIASFSVPLWPSALAVVIAGYLAYQSWKLSK